MISYVMNHDHLRDVVCNVMRSRAAVRKVKMLVALKTIEHEVVNSSVYQHGLKHIEAAKVDINWF